VARVLRKIVRMVTPGRDKRESHASDPRGVNDYWRQSTADEIAAGQHKDFVGGMWDEIGDLQIGFLKARGLSPGHRLVDIGCGSLRGGVRCVSYLDRGNYYGLDINASLIEAGREELVRSGLTGKQPNLLVNDKFEMSRFGVSFDYAIAVSVFTHLYMNHIARCLVEARKVLKPGGKLFATFFESPSSLHVEPIAHDPKGVVPNYDADPFHYSFAGIERLAETAGLSAEHVGDWGHPRDQRMLCFSPG
jgi:SAM-dependent methyltransferase